MQGRQRIRNPVLLKVVARGHLSAEAIATVRDGHLHRRVRRRLNQYRHVQPRESKGVGDRALVGGMPQREANRSLERLQAHMERPGSS